MQKGVFLLRYLRFSQQIKPRLFRSVILLAAILVCSTPAMAQDLTVKKTDLQLTGASIKEALMALQKQTGILFAFGQQLDKYDSVTVDISQKDITVAKALDLILKDTNLGYRQVKSQVVIEEKKSGQTPNDPTGHGQQGKGTMKGRITEAGTTEPLIGATVRILGTERGAMADLDGNYRFENVPAGKQTIEVSYMGFKTEQLEVQVTASRTATHNVELELDSKLLSEVVIQGRPKFSSTFTSDIELVSEMKELRAVASGISNELISKTADRNAADVAKRISGVSVVDDKFIVVRGMNQRYNITYLNQNVAPSTELYSRAFAYDMLPTSVIDRIVVYKTPTAELMGDYAGGAVRVYTKNMSPVKTIHLGVQFGYRDGTTLEDMNAYKGGKYDWIGLDDGTRRMPAIPGFRETGGRQTMTQEEMVSSFTNTWQYGKLKAMPDMQVFFNYSDNWRIFGTKRLYSMTALTYTNENRHYVQERMSGSGWRQLEDETWGKLMSDFSFNDQSTQIRKLNLVKNFTFAFNDDHYLEFNNFLLNDARDNVTVNTSNPWEFYYPGVSDITMSVRKQQTFKYQRRLLYNGNLGGIHNFGKAAQNLRWNAGYSHSLQDIPDQRIVNLVGRPDNQLLDDEAYKFQGEIKLSFAGGGGLMNRLFIKNIEDVYTFSADYTLKSAAQLELKVGTYQLYRTRETDRRFFKVLPGNFTGRESSWEGNVPSVYENDRQLTQFQEASLAWLWDARNFPDDGTGLKLFDVSSPADRYFAAEQNNSGYLQGEWAPLGGKLVFNAGLRVEHNIQRIAGAQAESDREGTGSIVTPVPVHIAATDWLPSVNANFRPDSAWVFRAGYGRTLNRPELREIAPFDDFDYTERLLMRGNPYLKSSVIDNYDLRLEFYPRNDAGEAVSFGAFYKHIANPIEQVRRETTETEDYANLYYINADKAVVYGLELELRKSLGFIPGRLFHDLSVVLNGTYVKSESSREKKGPGEGSSGLEGFSGRALQGQAPYVLNAGLFYENNDWKTKLGVTYNVTGPSLFAIGSADPEQMRRLLQKRFNGETLSQVEGLLIQTGPSLIEAPRHLLDFSVTQRLFHTVSLKLNVQNILDQPYRLAEDSNWNFKWDRATRHTYIATDSNNAEQTAIKGDNEYVLYHPGRYVSLSITCAF